MKRWKILFVGVGSIAKRHIKNIVILMGMRGEQFQIDIFRTGLGRPLEPEIVDVINDSYNNEVSVPNDYDVIFVTNPTQIHLTAMQVFGKKGRHFFIEKPLCTIEQLEGLDLSVREKSVYYVSSPLRYSSVIRYMKENIVLADVLAVRCISSSYLPDWRPEADYRKIYSARRELGGGVSIDLIHEWDYLIYLFGFPREVKSFIRRVSRLEIDSDDLAVYIADFGSMLAEIHVDYIGRSTMRKIEILMNEDTIEGDLLSGKIKYLKSGRVIDLCQERDCYQIAELEYFWQLIEGNKYGKENIIQATKILSIAGGEGLK